MNLQSQSVLQTSSPNQRHQHDQSMSLSSASGDARYQDDNGEGSSAAPFLGSLLHPRSNNELHTDTIPDDTIGRPSLPAGDEKQHRDAVTFESQVPNQNKTPIHQADSKPAKNPQKKKVTFPVDEKPHAGASDLEDEDLSDLDDSEHESGDVFTIYDAVAGRLGYDGLVKDKQQPVSAAEYLFRYHRGPHLDQNYEQFSAHRHLAHHLPDSDLLKAIHSHASDFYGAMPDTKDSFESMDETALIAMGILLEELAAERLGRTGDLAFVEAAQPGEADYSKDEGRGTKRQKIKHEGHVKLARGFKAESGSSDEQSSVDDRGRSSGQKRRRGARMDESDIPTEEEVEHTEDAPSHNSDVESWISQTMLDSQGEPSSQFGAGTDLPIR